MNTFVYVGLGATAWCLFVLAVLGVLRNNQQQREYMLFEEQERKIRKHGKHKNHR